ncbi:hypothetical protein Tco_1489283, partial [Tanacetum coccineum]
MFNWFVCVPGSSEENTKGIWLRRLLTEVTRQWIPPVTLFVDNQSALELMKNPVFHGRRYTIPLHSRMVKLQWLGKEEKADILTKPLAKVKHEEMRNLMG